MWFQQLVREETGCATYMIGAENGECLVFDPLWDLRPYIETAEKKGACIRYVIDSHTHADHVSGARRLAAEIGAELILPEGAETVYEARRAADGERIRMGEVVIEIAHVPGHRPELINLIVTDESRGSEPWCILTADFILVGDIARPDLAQDGEEGAGMLFDQALPRIAGLPDFVEVYPGHVAGSTCGRVTSGKHVTTLGYERRFSPALQIDDREAFSAYLNHGQPSRPANVERIVRINLGAEPDLEELPEIIAVTPQQLEHSIENSGAFVVDTRDVEAYGAGHIPKTHNFQVTEGEFEQRIGWVYTDYRPERAPIFLVGETEEAVFQALFKLAFVGLAEQVAGYLAGGPEAWVRAGKPLETLPELSARRLADWRSGVVSALPTIVDVRDSEEWEQGHIPGATQMSFKEIFGRLDELSLDRNDPVVVYCAGGSRSSTAGGILLQRGFLEVHNLSGGFDSWRAAGLPVE